MKCEIGKYKCFHPVVLFSESVSLIIVLYWPGKGLRHNMSEGRRWSIARISIRQILRKCVPFFRSPWNYRVRVPIVYSHPHDSMLSMCKYTEGCKYTAKEESSTNSRAYGAAILLFCTGCLKKCKKCLKGYNIAASKVRSSYNCAKN